MLSKLYHRVWKKIEKQYIERRTTEEGIVFAEKNLIYGKDLKNNTYDVFYKNNLSGRIPTIFMFHGGGYVSGSKEGSTKICQQLAQKGFLVFNMEYTKCDREEKKYLPYQIYEFFSFYKHITTSSNYKGIIDYQNIFLAGNSAGGHIAALIANIQTNPELKYEYNLQGGPMVKGVILLSPSLGAYNFAGMFPKKQYHNVLFGEKNVRSELYQLTHNLEITTEAFPPTIMFSTKGDFVVGAHKKCFLDLAKELNLSVQHYEICSGYKLFHSSMVEHADKYPLCINKIEEFIQNARLNNFVYGLTNEKLFEKSEEHVENQDTSIETNNEKLPIAK